MEELPEVLMRTRFNRSATCWGKHDLGKEICSAVEGDLKANGKAMKQGKTNDATLIAAAPSSTTKNEKKESDPVMHKSKKWNQLYHRFAVGFACGMEVHIDVDSESGLTHAVETTSADVHDLPQPLISCTVRCPWLMRVLAMRGL
jgi:hypothetical protein